ncbi:MAG: nitrate- and nitrite sensing domain-containing protein [Robiginitomaculum sp.]|nr:nitrate- and nitrite sensing domain-containing protein [Robiginitomaculum sp.]MDQ7078091.1 nitrate- and nitrite sensing domain-containing protein [Robiginitomaculum sp.]
MNFIRNMKLSHMIMILALVPIITTISFSTQLVLQSTRQKAEMGKLADLTSLAVKMSHLVHEQQKERGATAVFLGSKGTKFSAELARQRKQTDAKKEALQKYLGDFDQHKYSQEFAQDLQLILNDLGKMDNIRNRVDALSIPAPQAIGYYTGLNGKVLSLIGSMSTLSPDPVVVSRIIGYTSFLQAKERAGIERAVGANGFSLGKFTPEAMKKFEALAAIQKTYNQVFLAHATQDQEKAYQAMMASPVVKDVQRMRDIAYKGGVEGELGNISVDQWFGTITKKINALKDMENLLNRDLLGELNKLRSRAAHTQMQTLLVTLIALAFVFALAYMIIRCVTSSLAGVTDAMTELAEGNLDVELPPVSKNEIGEMIRAVLIFKDNAIKKIELEAEQAAQKQRAEEERRILMDQMADEFDASVGSIVQNVSSASTELQSTAQSMSGIAENTSSMSAAVSAASEEAAANVQTVAAAAEEMSHSIAEINTQVSQASMEARRAVAEVEETSARMERLAATADSIGEVVQLISDIAEQTNLLALNATIESARAGEAGRGFAVVASEVKELASQTGKATEGISAQVEEIQQATKEAVIAMQDIGKSIRSVDETSAAIAAAMEEQGAATQEIARNVQEAATGTEEVSRNIVGVNQASEESGAAAGEVTSAAGELSAQAELLKGEVGKFIKQVRAG